MTESENMNKQAVLELLGAVCHLERRRSRTLLHELGLYRARHGILRLLWQEDGVSQTDLTRGSHVKAAAVSKTLQGMEEAGLVERRRDDRDRRVVNVYLTAMGRSLEQQGGKIRPQIAGEALAGLDADELAALESSLTRMRDNLSELVPDDRPARHGRDARRAIGAPRQRSRRPGRGRYIPDDAPHGVAGESEEAC